MQLLKEVLQARTLLGLVRNEVIVVREDGPCFESPAELDGAVVEELEMKVELLFGIEVWPLEVGSRGNELGSGGQSAPRRSVWP